MLEQYSCLQCTDSNQQISKSAKQLSLLLLTDHCDRLYIRCGTLSGLRNGSVNALRIDSCGCLCIFVFCRRRHPPQTSISQVSQPLSHSASTCRIPVAESMPRCSPLRTVARRVTTCQIASYDPIDQSFIVPNEYNQTGKQ
jgi:hypothetical protein